MEIPTIIQEYMASLKKVIAKEITWNEHHHNAREQMLLALCRGAVINPDIITEIKELESQACAVAGVPA